MEMTDITCTLCGTENSILEENRCEKWLLMGQRPAFPVLENGPLYLLECGGCGSIYISSPKRKKVVCDNCFEPFEKPVGYVYATNLEEKSHIEDILKGRFNTAECPNCNETNYLQFAMNTGALRYEIITSIQSSETFSSFLSSGRTYYILGKHKESAESYSKAERFHSQNKEFSFLKDDWLMFAAALDYLGRTQESVRYTEEAIALDPNCPTTLETAAVAYAKIGKPEKAKPFLERIVTERLKISDWYVDNVTFHAQYITQLIALSKQLEDNQEVERWEREARLLIEEYESFQRDFQGQQRGKNVIDLSAGLGDELREMFGFKKKKRLNFWEKFKRLFS